MIVARSFCLLVLIFMFEKATLRSTKTTKKKTQNHKDTDAFGNEKRSEISNKRFKIFPLGFLKSDAWKIKSEQKSKIGMKKSNIKRQNIDVQKAKDSTNRFRNNNEGNERYNEQFANIPQQSESKTGFDINKNNKSSLNTRGPTSNIITDLKVPKMGQAMQWLPNVDNESRNAVDNATQSQQTAPSNYNINNNDESKGQVDVKIKNLLNALGNDPDAPQNSTLLTNKTAGIRDDGKIVKDINAQKKQIIGPGYYEPECDDKKKCPDGHYCHMYVCVECHRNKHACTFREQCCNNMECVYGRCEQKPKGSPGAFCHKDKDCAGDACCVLEPTVDEEESICKPKLAEYHQCSPILYRKVWVGDNKPDCGPCKDGLKCMQKGNEGSHEVCMKET